MSLTTETLTTPLADAQLQSDTHSQIGLDWVGMTGIALPIELAGRPVNANVDIGINFQGQKGIHMSRLYQSLDALTQSELTCDLLRQTLEQVLSSHIQTSSKAYLRIYGDILLSRRSLVSNQFGWKSYPIEIDVNFKNSFPIMLKVGVPYSSTCPSSTALCAQVMQQQFALDFDNQAPLLPQAQVLDWLVKQGLPATPHSQRSWAWVTVTLNAEGKELPVIELINRIENILLTPVQTVVKRSDEQAFAITNGQNLMFCEDAARRLINAFSHQCQFDEVTVEIDHQESLHAHNAAARTSWKRGDHAA